MGLESAVSFSFPCPMSLLASLGHQFYSLPWFFQNTDLYIQRGSTTLYTSNLKLEAVYTSEMLGNPGHIKTV
jgi:hypothetical protein